MDAWVLHVLVAGGALAAAAAGLALHLRLVGYFDVLWGAWAMAGALVGVLVARATTLPLGMLAAALAVAALAVGQNAVVVPRLARLAELARLHERIAFSAALGAQLLAVSLAEAVGYRQQEMLPASSGAWGRDLVLLLACWGGLALAAALRLTQTGLRIRAVLDGVDTAEVLGLPSARLTRAASLLAGGLTGIGAASLGMLYVARTDVGMSILLLAAIPCIATSLGRSWLVVSLAVGLVAVQTTLRYRLGYASAEIMTNVLLLALLLWSPDGLAARKARTV